MSFPQLPSLLSEALVARGYTALTPVQSAVAEPDAHGRDLIVSAQTGSGKTVAFGVAMAEHLLEGDGDAKKAPYSITPLAIVIAPTRELALQVSRELSWLYAKAQARIVTCVGGMDASRERRNLQGGATIVVGTPGRLRDHLERGALDLSAVRVAVLDEADEMLDMGFREDLEEILDATPEGRRTLLFSATMPKPIVALAKRYQRDALRISTVGEDRGHGDISYQAITVAPADIENAVVNLLRFHEAESAMLFCATRDNVRRLHASLIERGFSAVALSGEHSQNERNHAMQALRDRRARVCVATDVAARGIDLPTLSLVVHVELPRDAEALQHRSGRTGRAGKKGTAVLIVPYPRRRRVEMMLRGARIEAQWMTPPTPDDIRRNDRERLIEALTQPVEADAEDQALASRVQETMSADAIAIALVQAHRTKMPALEELIDASVRPERGGDRGDRGGERGMATQRQGFEDTVWFRLNIGRRQNADPRWILPLLCRRGHITKNEVGAIKIGANDTQFDVPRGIADRFAEAVRRTASEDPDDGIMIEAMSGAGGSGGGGNAGGARSDGARREGHGGDAPSDRPAQRHHARPLRAAPGNPQGRRPPQAGDGGERRGPAAPRAPLGRVDGPRASAPRADGARPEGRGRPFGGGGPGGSGGSGGSGRPSGPGGGPRKPFRGKPKS